MSASSSSQPLAAKEQQLFRSLVKLYESKQYKKAIKAADAILKKVPEHGETLAMKGLTLNYMGGGPERKAEAYELVRRGLRADLKSHVCWHVYGLLYRSDANYPEAIKCYLNALRLDRDNGQILRDLAMLQVQTRDVAGFVETRHRLLAQKPAQRANWIAFAIGHHLDGNHDLAAQILTAYESTLEEVPASEAYEHSEMLLYKAQVLYEGGDAAAALQLLQAQRERVKDRLGAAAFEAELQSAVGNAAEAERLHRHLLSLNPDNYRTHEGLRRALGLAPAADGSVTDEQRAKLTALYAELKRQYPKSAAVQRIPLDFAIGDAFTAAADAFCRRYVERGIPSLFSAVAPLCADADKAAALGALFGAYEASLRATGALPPPLNGEQGEQQQQQQQAGDDDASSSNGNGVVAAGDNVDAAAAAATSSSSGGAAGGKAAAANGGGHHAGLRPIELTDAQRRADEQEKDALLWVLHAQSQLRSWLGDTAGALAASDEALARGPDVVELKSARAAILGAAGDVKGEVHWAEAARGADLADRFLNSLAVDAHFRAGDAATAERVATLFTRDGGDSAGTSLHDMQHMAYECAAGEAALRAGALGPALKSFTAVVKHFADISEDQFDFHSYCVRKMTLRAYVGLLRFEDKLYGHGFFARAAWGAVAAYVRLADQRARAAAGAAGGDDDEALAALSPEERKREKQRRKKEEKRAAAAAAAAEEEAARRAAAERGASSSGGGAAGKDGGGKGGGGGGGKGGRKGPAKPADPDPDGAKLAATEDPLGEATKLVAKLKAYAPNDLRTHLAAFEVYVRKGRLLLALSAAKRAAAIAGSNDGDAHRCLVRLARAVDAAPPEAPALAAVVRKGLAELLGGGAKTAADAAAAYFDANSAPTTPLGRRAAAAEMLALVDPASKPRALKALLAGGVAGAGLGALRQVLAAAPLPGRAPAGGLAAALDDCADVERSLACAGAPLADAAAAAEWRQLCAAAFPHSTHFGGALQWTASDDDGGGDGGSAAVNGVARQLAGAHV